MAEKIIIIICLCLFWLLLGGIAGLIWDRRHFLTPEKWSYIHKKFILFGPLAFFRFFRKKICPNCF